jgi:hypothetical protein
MCPYKMFRFFPHIIWTVFIKKVCGGEDFSFLDSPKNKCPPRQTSQCEKELHCSKMSKMPEHSVWPEVIGSLPERVAALQSEAHRWNPCRPYLC